MAQRPRSSFEKLQRERDRQERGRRKRSQRHDRRSEKSDDEVVDEQGLMTEYGALAERHAAGEIGDKAFGARKRAIFAALGIEV